MHFEASKIVETVMQWCCFAVEKDNLTLIKIKVWKHLVIKYYKILEKLLYSIVVFSDLLWKPKLKYNLLKYQNLNINSIDFWGSIGMKLICLVPETQ